MCFNLIPVYPLDGSHIMRGLLPRELGESYYEFMVRFGSRILLLLLIRPVLLDVWVGQPAIRLATLLVGG